MKEVERIDQRILKFISIHAHNYKNNDIIVLVIYLTTSMSFESNSPKELPLKRFIYRHYKEKDPLTGERLLIFECTANGILEADKLYEQATGNNPSKQPDVGCSIASIDNE